MNQVNHTQQSPTFARADSRSRAAWRHTRMMWIALSVTALGLLAAGCASVQPPPNVTPVSPFDVQRYEGRWYELARLDHSFERGMTDVSAHYTLQADGTVRVVNRGYLPARTRWNEAVGRAKFVGEPNVGALKVSFFGPFYGGYNIAALDPDYRWALVVGENTEYAWILARDKQIEPGVRDAILAKARSVGVNTHALIWVKHERQDPAHDTAHARSAP